jgi:hypothetical protein
MKKSNNDALIGAIFNAKRALENALRWNKDPPVILLCHDVQALIKAAESQLVIIETAEKTDPPS